MVSLSVVITYYQTYDLTLRLLKELSIQKTNNVEYILVDDGCNETRFDTFKDFTIIHLAKNGGVSKARNVGTEYARGKYIAYCDSDDLVMPDYISHLLNIIDKYSEDVILFNWLDTTTNDVIRRPQNCAVWKAIYKKDILPRFDESLRVREDYFFQQELKKRNPTIAYYDRVLYLYNSGREGSLWWNETHK